MKHSTKESGFTNGLVIPLILAVIAVVGLAGFGIWAFMGYVDYKDNADAKIAAAVVVAKKEQAAADELQFREEEKKPVRVLVGPDDLGRVQLDYPKTWSVYVAQDGGASRGNYEAYLHPGSVPPVGNTALFALRVSITDEAYDKAVLSYEPLVKKGDLKSSAVTIEGQAGVRLDGTFSNKAQGSMVIVKVRDKALRLYTESNTFKADFENIVLKSLKFNP